MSYRNVSIPVLKKGKLVSVTNKSKKEIAIEQAKQTWYIEYSYNGKQCRIKRGLNRVKDYRDKEYRAQVLLEVVKRELADGFNPFDPKAYVEQTRKEHITLKEAISIFLEYHATHDSRKKTIATYASKLKALDQYYPEKLLKDFTTREIEKFISAKISDKSYSHNSVKSAKRVFNTFFNVLSSENYVSHNPMFGFNKKIKSTKEVDGKHMPYSDLDLTKILSYLDVHDPFTAFFCRMVYYTCMRPGEIRGLRIKDINLVNNTITVRASVKKTTNNNEADIINIDKSLLKHLESLNLKEYPKEYFLIGSTTNIVGPNKVGENTPYNKLISAFRKIDQKAFISNPMLKEEEKLVNKGYDLYSFKHTSNIKKYNAGWTLTEIMKANRHGSISMTEIYLKKIGSFTDTTHLEIPAI